MNEDKIGYPIYRMNEIHNGLCDSEVSKCAEITQNELETFTLKDRDVLFNRTNSFEWVGRTGLYKKIDSRNFIFASYLVRFIPNKKYLLPEYLTAFLNTKYGIWDVKRRARQSINQTNVNPEEVKEIDIPLLSLKFQEKLEKLYNISHQKRIESQKIYSQAENHLLETLGLQSFEPSKEPVNVKNFKESFLIFGRLDAEYYQKKYDDIENRIRKFGKFEKIKNIRTANYRGLQPVYIENGELDVINSRHILETTLDYGNFEKTNKESWALQKRARVHRNDILIYTTGANIGRTQVYLSDKKALASNHVNILRLKSKINSIYVAFVMNCIVGRLQTEKHCAGSAQVELYPKNIDEFIIPLIDETNQHKIQSLIEESFRLKKQSEQLLELAKTAVEKAIEENEEAALEFINLEVGKLENYPSNVSRPLDG